MRDGSLAVMGDVQRRTVVVPFGVWRKRCGDIDDEATSTVPSSSMMTVAADETYREVVGSGEP